jgi:uncharacterized protein YecT (DUF1311 family)
MRPSRLAVCLIVASSAAVSTSLVLGATPPTAHLDRSCEKTAGTQQALDACAYSELAQLGPQLAAALASEAKHYARSRVDAAQAAWLEYRASECGLEASFYAGGTIQPMIFADCEVSLTLTRIDDLLRVVVLAETH